MNTEPKPAAAPAMVPKIGSKAIVGLVGLAVGLVVGYGAGRVSTGTPINPLTGKGGSYDEGYAAAKKKMAERGLLPAAPEELTQFAGTVVSVTNGSFVLEGTLTVDLLETPKTEQRTILTTASTKILTRAKRTSEEQAQAEADFQKKLQAGEPATPPDPYKLVPYASALKVGDKVSVETTKDVLKNTSVEALTVLVVNAP